MRSPEASFKLINKKIIYIKHGRIQRTCLRGHTVAQALLEPCFCHDNNTLCENVTIFLVNWEWIANAPIRRSYI